VFDERPSGLLLLGLPLGADVMSSDASLVKRTFWRATLVGCRSRMMYCLRGFGTRYATGITRIVCFSRDSGVNWLHRSSFVAHFRLLSPPALSWPNECIDDGLFLVLMLMPLGSDPRCGSAG